MDCKGLIKLSALIATVNFYNFFFKFSAVLKNLSEGIQSFAN